MYIFVHMDCVNIPLFTCATRVLLHFYPISNILLILFYSIQDIVRPIPLTATMQSPEAIMAAWSPAMDSMLMFGTLKTRFSSTILQVDSIK